MARKSKEKSAGPSHKSPPETVVTPTSLPVNQEKLEEKLTKYLLNPHHEKGRFKAAYFKGLGYTLENWKALAGQLVFDIGKAKKEEETKWGTQPYTQYIKINSADGKKSSIIKTGWEQKAGREDIDFITVYPSHKDNA